MKVLYDISWLGLTNGSPTGQTGLGRVIEALACRLARSNECDLTLCAGDSFAAVAGGVAFLESHEELKQVPFAYPKLDAAFHTPAHKVLTRIDARPRQSLASRAVRRVVRDASHWSERRRSSLRRSIPPGTQIYHSPFLAIPNDVREQPAIRSFLTVYDLIPLLFPQLAPSGAPELLRSTLASLKQNDFIFCISQATKDDLCNRLSWLNPEQIFVTHLAASAHFRPVHDRQQTAEVRKKYGIPDEPYILTLSAVEPRKGMEHAIRCFRRLALEVKDTQLNLVLAGPKGWKYEGIVKEATRSTEIARRVIMTGRIDDDDLPALYSGAVVFVFPSLYEGFGLPVLEAMQCGTPVVASNTSSLPEVVGDAGVLIPPHDVDALCQAVLAIYQSTARRAELSARARARAAEFSWEKCARQTIGAYRTACEEGADSAR